MKTITKQDFLDYEAVRRSGVTNMFDLSTVQCLSGLDSEKIMDIMNNYGKYKKEFLGKE